jgi:hypothetical protein
MGPLVLAMLVARADMPLVVAVVVLDQRQMLAVKAATVVMAI